MYNEHYRSISLNLHICKNVKKTSTLLLFFQQQHRRLELITFDDVKKPDTLLIEPKNAIHIVVVMARINPCESPTSFVIQGLIEFLAIANHPIAKLLRENVVFKIIPMVNPG